MSLSRSKIFLYFFIVMFKLNYADSQSVGTGTATPDSTANFQLMMLPTITTSSATSITPFNATLNGICNPNGFETSGWFRFSTVNPGTCNNSFGTRAPTSGGIALGSGTSAVNYSEPITGLAPNTTYYCCAIAENQSGMAFGNVTQFITPWPPAPNTLSATYTSDIPTSFATYDNSCNGPSTVLIITLPPGDNYVVTNVDVAYNMTAQGAGQKAHQRSKIKFENTGVTETEVAGSGNTTGIQTYNRSISIANGTYTGGTQLIFQMLAMRTVNGTPTGCGSSVNRVDANSWTITVHYSSEIVNPKVGINTLSPSQTVDIAGKLKLGDDSTSPIAGTVRWNASTQDFEGYNGTEWISFTKNEGDGWGSKNIYENRSASGSNGLAGDNFGQTVSIHGDYIIAGAHLHDGINSNQGEAYIFQYSEGSWTQHAILSAGTDAAINAYFGQGVSIFEDYAIVGAYGRVNGRCYIFKRTGSTWAQEAILIASDGTSNDNFGRSVSISGEYCIAGAHGKDIGSNVNQGKAYIFKRTGAVWNQEASFTALDGAANDNFGRNLAISGNYAIIGAFSKDIGSTIDQGKAYIFERIGTNWVELMGLIAPDGASGDQFGYSVAINGDYAIVGTPAKDIGTKQNQGKAYIYKRTGSNWDLMAELIASDGAETDNFGNSVSITENYAIIAAEESDIGSNSKQGKVYVFRRFGSNWIEQAGCVSSDGSPIDYFGSSVSISGNHFTIGARLFDNGSNTDEGKIYFFSKE